MYLKIEGKLMPRTNFTLIVFLLYFLIYLNFKDDSQIKSISLVKESNIQQQQEKNFLPLRNSKKTGSFKN